MAPSPVVAWFLAIAAAVTACMVAYRPFKRGINATMFLGLMEKLAKQRDVKKIRKLCVALAHSPLSRLTQVAFELELPRVELVLGTEGSFRRAPDQVPFEQRAREALAPIVDQELSRDKPWRLAVVVPIALGGASIAAPGPTPARVIAGIAIAIGLGAWNMHRGIRRGLEEGLARLPTMVLPEEELDDE